MDRRHMKKPNSSERPPKTSHFTVVLFVVTFGLLSSSPITNAASLGELSPIYNETNHILTDTQIREETNKFKRVLSEENDDLVLMEVTQLDTKFAHYKNKSQLYPVLNQTEEAHLRDIWSSTPLPAATIDETSPTIDTTETTPKNEVYSLAGKIILSSLAATASLITVCGNLLVMFSFFLDRQIRNPTNYFILSLSVSDFLIGLISMPFLTFYLMLGYWPFGKIICNLWLSLDYTVCLTSIYTVLFITIDRFCSVRMPAKYRNWRTPDKIILMVAFTWVLPILLFFTSIFGWSFTLPDEPYSSQCDVAWSSNKIFSFILVVSYFWSTLIVIIVLYIFIYQVARNLERKSREKQRKLSSLVGASASNTGALVSVVALPNQQLQQTQLQPKKSFDDKTAQDPSKQKANSNLTSSDYLPNKDRAGHKLIDTTTPDDPEDQDEFNDSGSQLRLSKTTSTKKRKKQESSNEKKGVSLKTSGVIFKGTLNTPPTAASKSNSATLKNILKNNNNSAQLTSANKYLGEKQSQINSNHSFASSTVSNNDDFSSSYESHSDYDLHKKQATAKHSATAKKPTHMPKATHGSKSTSVGKNSIVAAMIQQKSGKPTATIVNKDEQSASSPQVLKPRPESLAVMSNDQFAEKCAKQSSSNLNSQTNLNQSPSNFSVSMQSDKKNLIESQPKVGAEKPSLPNGNKEPSEDSDKKDSQIPFIDDEFEELSYVLTRRHIAGDKENKIPIKEEKILIKSPLKSSFFRKFSSPIKNISSRRSSQKSQHNETNNATMPVVTNGNYNSTVPLLPEPVSDNLKLGDNDEACERDKLLKNNVDSPKMETGNHTLTVSSNNMDASTNQTKITPSSTFTAVTISNSSPIHLNPKSTTTTTTVNEESKATKACGFVYTDSIQKHQQLTPPKTTTTTASSTTTASQTVLTRPPVSQPRPLATKRKNKHENRARKALRTITFILGAFIFCFAPWHVVSIYNPFCPECFQSNFYHHFFYSCYFLCYLNSPINPFMYALANQQFKKVFLRILRGDFRRI